MEAQNSKLKIQNYGINYLIKKFISFALCILSFAFVFYQPLAFGDFIPGEIVVKFKPDVIKMPKGMAVASIKAATVTVASVRALNVKYGVTKLEQIYKDALEIRPDWKHLENDYLLTFAKEKSVAQAVKDYKKDPNVVTATLNTVVRAFETTPDDPYFNQQWGLAKIAAPRGWDRTTGSSSAEIAVLDTGINYNHEDFAEKVDLAKAKNYVSDNNDPLDDYGHGTAVSGVIAAATDNGKGIAGVEWKAVILPIKVLNNEGEGSITNINQGLAYLTALKSQGTSIEAINMSLGQDSPDSNLEARCSEAYNQGIVLVAAAGNHDWDTKSYPAAYESVIAVAATDQNDQRSVWKPSLPPHSENRGSNYGAWVDVSAPGTGILSTDKSGSYSGGSLANGWNGTSLASPFVAGLAALVKVVNPTMTNAQIMDRIKTSTDEIYAQNPDFVGLLGGGRINAYKALAGLTAQITSPSGGEYLKGTKEIRGTATGWNFASYRLEALKNGSVITIETSSVSVEGGRLGTWETSGLNGDYTIFLRAYATDGSFSEASISVFVDNTSPEVAIVSPTNGATVEGKVTIIGKAKDQYLDRYILGYGEGTAPSTFQNLGTFYVGVDNGVLGTWETAGLKGAYILRLTAYNKVGEVSTASVEVSIAEVAPTREVQAMSGLPITFVLPNPFDRTSTSETVFVYNLQGNFNTTIYLFDLNGNLIWRKSYGAGENGGKSGMNSPAWDGQNLYGEKVPNGVYFYQVTADQKVIARGKIIVLN